MKPVHDAPQSRFDLVDTFPQQGCAICAITHKRLVHYFESLNYDSVGDPGVRQHFMESGGYCNVHAWQWLDIAFVLGTASLYKELLQDIRQQIESLTWQPNPVIDRVGSFLTGRRTERHLFLRENERCPACTWQRETEDMLANTVVDNLREPDFRTALEHSSGFCLPHFQQVINRVKTRADFDLLRDQMLQQETLLLDQLAEIIRKHDYRYQNEPPGPEVGAATRAVAHDRGFQGRAPDSRRAAD